jgi:hypothetical protein
LIGSNVNPDNMSQEERQSAHERLTERRFHLQTLPNLIKARKQQEFNPLLNASKTLHENIVQTQVENTELNAQLKPLLTKRNNLVKEILNGNLPRLAASLDSTEKMILQFGEVGISPLNMRPQPQDSAAALRKELAELRKTGKTPPTPEKLLMLVNLLPESERVAANQLLQNRFANQLQTKPIPSREVSFILRQLDLLLDKTKAADKIAQQKAAPAMAPLTAPTPFSMKPK